MFLSKMFVIIILLLTVYFYSAYVYAPIECLEDFVGGLFWNVAFDGDIVSRPCRNIDSIFRYEHYYNMYLS